MIHMLHSKQGLALVEPVLGTILYLAQATRAIDAIFEDKRTMKLLRHHMMSGVVANVAPYVGELSFCILRIVAIYHRKAISDSFDDAEIDSLYQEPPDWFVPVLDEVIDKRKQEDYLELNHVAEKFDKAELEMLKRHFKEFDEDGSGSIDGDELMNLMEATGELPYAHLATDIVRKHKLEQFMSEADVDGDGTLDINEFLLLFYRLREMREERERKAEEKAKAKKANLKNSSVKMKEFMKSSKVKKQEEEEALAEERLKEEEALLEQQLEHEEMIEREDKRWNPVRRLHRKRNRQAGLQRRLREMNEEDDAEFLDRQARGEDPLFDLRQRLLEKRERLEQRAAARG